MTGFATGHPGAFLRFAAFLVMLSGLCWSSVRPAYPSPELEMSGFVIVQETDNGRWEIQARSASYVNEEDVLLSGVSAKMILNGKDRISVISETGRFESGRQVLHLEGNVVIASRWGSSLHAPSVRWDGPEDYIEASGGVELERGPVRVYGSSARYTIDTGTALILGKVRTILDSEKSRR